MPSPIEGSPNSSDEQIIPLESSPRSFASLISMPFGKIAPTLETTTCRPAFTFLAPQTICFVSFPKSTSQTLSLSASGCFLHVRTFPTTIFFGTLILSKLSTSRPIAFSVLQTSSEVIPFRFFHSFNHVLVNII